MTDMEIDDIEIDLSDLDFTDIEAKYAVQEPDSLSNVVIVDNVPVVDEVKAEKLLAILKKTFAKWGKCKNDENGGFYMPMVDDPKSPGKKLSRGFLFVECESAKDVAEIIKNGHGFRLDKTHVFSVTKFSDFEKYLNVTEVFVAPTPQPFKQKEHLGSWLTDVRGRDQFLTLAGDEASVCWNNKLLDPEVVKQKTAWTDAYLQWSPLGTYLTTFHKQGLAIWGGESWERIQRFPHPNVKLIEFSPDEHYVVTWSVSTSDPNEENVFVWDVNTGTKIRGFHVPSPADPKDVSWPLFKWSPNSQFIARTTSELLSVYELPSMALLDNKSMKYSNIVEFHWSPKDSIIVFWTPEVRDNPARVTLVELPSKNVVRTKNLFNVSDVKLSWHSAGDFLLTKIDRLTKTKKATYPTLEVFCLRSKGVPIDVYESFKEKIVHSVNWEPDNDRFAVLLTDQQKTMVQFFKMEKDGIKELAAVEKKNVSQLFWSPRGRFMVLAGLKNFQGELEFFDADEMQTISLVEHHQASDVEWDPTGRYVISSSSFWKVPGENGFIVWDFQGHNLFKSFQPKFKQVIWRPRPPTLLSKEHMKNLRKDLAKFSAIFDKEDSTVSNVAQQAALDARNKLIHEWKAWRNVCAKRYAEQREARAKLRGAVGGEPIYSDNEEEDDEMVDEMVEEVIEETSEIVS